MLWAQQFLDENGREKSVIMGCYASALVVYFQQSLNKMQTSAVLIGQQELRHLICGPNECER